MWYVSTTEGVDVFGRDKDHPEGKMTEGAAKASADERNVRAEALGMKGRYVAKEG